MSLDSWRKTVDVLTVLMKAGLPSAQSSERANGSRVQADPIEEHK